MAAINATLADANGLTYTPNNGFSGPDALALSAVDPLSNSNSASVQINVVGLPTVSTPAGPLGVNENGALAINGVSVADGSLLSSSDDVQLALAVGQGTLNVSTTVNGGVTSAQVSGDLTGAVTLTGTLAEINATLANASGLIYTPASGYSGTDTLTATINDLGNTASGVPQAASRSVQINVGPSVTVPAGPLTIKQTLDLPISGMSVAAGGLLSKSDNVQLTLAAGQGALERVHVRCGWRHGRPGVAERQRHCDDYGAGGGDQRHPGRRQRSDLHPYKRLRGP